MKHWQTNTPLLIAVIAVAASCRASSDAEPWTVDELVSTAQPAADAQSRNMQPGMERIVVDREVAHPDDGRFIVHEWGTFTSMQGSDGSILPGMHYEEESLPAFVHGRVPPPPPGMPPNKRVEDLLLDGITQKLETPVIYFYGAPERVEVKVDFPRGVISQWYPDATSYAPQAYEAEFSPDDILNGTMTWSLDVLGADAVADLVAVPSDDVWAPSRNVEAQPVRFGDETEKFIFYRGLGRFDMPFRVTSVGSQITVHNHGSQDVVQAWALHWNGEHGAVWPLGSVAANKTVQFSPVPKELPQPEYLDAARHALAEGLQRSGLTKDESWAMVDTWNRSYFHTEGLRILYIVPRTWTDELLPITITPEPDEVVRTLVGRVEVLTQDDEQALLEQLRAGEWEPQRIGRFAEPKLQRALTLAADDEALRQQIMTMIAITRDTAMTLD